jgi:alpha-tubulin suppressor-like RCC1 family protein
MGKAAGTCGQIRVGASASGETRFYIVDLVPTGFIVVAADDELEPIIAFSHEGQLLTQATDPLFDILQQDTEGRARRLHVASAATQTASGAKAKWELLAASSPRPAAAANPTGADAEPAVSIATPDDVRVDPLVQSQWNQVGFGFNYYAPNLDPAGCVAIAWAQIMRFHQWPATGVGTSSFTISVDGVSQQAALRGGDGAGGPYDWADMVLVPDNSVTTTQAQAIGALCYDAGVANNMAYSASGSATNLQTAAIKSVFHYANGATVYVSNNSLADTILALRTNLDAGLPVALDIASTSGIAGHEPVCDGYGYNLGTLYHHLNMGWGGESDAWYNLPNMEAWNGLEFMDYNFIVNCTYNIDPSVSGEIISGRVTDFSSNPVAGVAVTAAAGSSKQTATTNQRGIFFFKGLAANTTWTVTRTGGAAVYGPSQTSVTTGSSADGSAVGDRVVDDFQAPALAITTEPATQCVTAGGNAIFVTAASGTPSPSLQWQVSTDGGSTWTNLSDLPPYSGAATGTLTIAGVTAAMTGYQYHCVASNSLQGTLVTNSATLTIITPGSLWATGGNSSGQLGDGTTTQSNTPELILPGALQAVSAGNDFSLFLKTDGSLWATGDNSSGQLGDGTTAQQVAPELILPSGVEAVSAGYNFSLVLKTDGSLWATGGNSSGQLGDGTTTQHLAPELILPSGVAAVSAGGRYYLTPVPSEVPVGPVGEGFSLILKTDGSLWATGDNSSGQLGDGTTTQHLAPELILPNGVAAVSAGGNFCLIVKTDGSLWAMGDNSSGQLGDGTTTQQLVPELIIPGGVAAVSAGYTHSLIVKTDGSLWAMGDNSSGQLGDGTTTQQLVPELIIPGGVAAVSAGWEFSLILKEDGGLWAMGDNSSGQLGDGTTTPHDSPELVAVNVQAFAAGAYHWLVVGSADVNLFGPVFTSQPLSQTTFARLNAAFTAAGWGVPTPTLQWQICTTGGAFGTWTNLTDTAPYSGTATGTLAINGVTTDMSGYQYRCLASNSVVSNVPSSAAVLTVSLNSNPPPTITTQPVSQLVAYDGNVTFAVVATGATSYQWYHNSVPIPGATAATLTFSSVTASNAGSYSVTVTGPGGSGTITSAAANLTVTPEDPLAAKLINISTRSLVDSGNNSQIAGFVISGTEPKTVLIRASGPALAQYQVTGVLPDPALKLFDSTSTVINHNTGWGSDAAIAAAAAKVGAFAWAAGSADSALLVNLQPGSYTAQVTGSSGDSGVALIEVYDADSGSSRLINISTRSMVQAGGNSQIAGFVVTGSQPKTVLIRASGPALAQYQVTGVLPDPALKLFDSTSTVINQNTGWGSDAAVAAAAAKVGAFAWAAGSADSALLVTLQPGSYTAQVTGSSGDSGVALIEVYDVP